MLYTVLLYFLNQFRLKEINTLEAKLNRLENPQQISNSEDVRQEINVRRTELNTLLRHRAEFLMSF